MDKKIAFLTLTALALQFSCIDKPEATEFGKSFVRQIDSVEIQTAKVETFQKEIISNGKLEAIQKTDLQFAINGIVDALNVKSGQRVTKGELIANLNDEALQLELEQAQIALEKAQLEYRDVMIGQGYIASDSFKIPDDFKRIAAIKSGLDGAKLNLKKAQHNIRQSSIYAPFSGVIANLELKKHDQANAYKRIMEIISNELFYVRFTIMESDYHLVRANQKLKLQTIDGVNYTGVIDHLNPMVNEYGLVTIFGRVFNPTGELIEGMSVKVWVFSEVPQQLVVEKSAVQKRDGKAVVFTLKNDSVAHWNYVTLELENSTHYTISEGLHSGDKVIVSNNNNLAHKSIVKVTNHESR